MKRHIILYALAGALSACAGSTKQTAQTKSAISDTPADGRFQLKNGLTLIVQENHASRAVALQLWVKAGAADEGDGERGLAQLQQRLLLKPALTHAIQGVGGTLSARTSLDDTVFEMSLAGQNLGTGVDVLSQLVGKPTFDAADVDREKQTLRDELKKQSSLPARKLSDALFETAFSTHPYRYPVRGSADALQKISKDDVKRFFERFYSADNLVLVVAGDVTAAEVKQRVEKALGGLRGGKEGERKARAQEPAAKAARQRTLLDDDLREGFVACAWPIPSIEHADVPALQLLSVILGQGESARLAQKLKRQDKSAKDTYSFAFAAKDPGLLTAGLVASPEKVAEAQRALLREAYRLHSEPVSDRELAKAKRLLLSDAYNQKETVEGQARKAGFFAATAGDVAFEKRFYENIERVALADIRRVAAKYLRLDNMRTVVLLPKASASALSAEDVLNTAKSLEAALVQHQTPALPKANGAGVYTVTLPSGAVVLLQEDHSVPIVAVRAAFVGGVRFEDKQTNGISHVLARLLAQSTAKRSREQVAIDKDMLSASIEGFSGLNTFGLYGEFLQTNFAEGLELLSEMVTQPGFKQEDLERERATVLEDIRSRDENLSGLAFELFTETLFENHPFRLRSVGNVESVSALRADQLQQLYARNYGRDRLVIALVGDFNPETALEQLDRLLGSPLAQKSTPHALTSEPPLAAAKNAVRLKAKGQAHAVIGFRGATVADRDRYALELLSTMLNGEEGRLSKALKGSLAFQVASVSIEGLEPGYFATYVGTSPDKLDKSVEALKGELQRISQAPIAQDELDRARQFLIGTHALRSQRASARAAALAFEHLFGLPTDEEAHYAEELGKLTVNEVQRVAREYLDMNRAVVAIVRPPEAAAAKP